MCHFLWSLITRHLVSADGNEDVLFRLFCREIPFLSLCSVCTYCVWHRWRLGSWMRRTSVTSVSPFSTWTTSLLRHCLLRRYAGNERLITRHRKCRYGALMSFRWASSHPSYPANTPQRVKYWVWHKRNCMGSNQLDRQLEATQGLESAEWKWVLYRNQRKSISLSPIGLPKEISAKPMIRKQSNRL